MEIGRGRIGIRPIGMAGWDTLSLTTSALLRKQYSQALPTSGLLAARTIMSSLPTSGLLCTRIVMPYLETSAELYWAVVLPTSANIRATFEGDPLPTSALLSVRTAMDALPTSGLLADRTVMDALPTSANLMARFYAVMETSGLLADRTVMDALPTSAYIVSRYLLDALGTSGLLAARTIMSTLDTSATLINRYFVPALPTSAYLISANYYAIVAGSTVLSLRNKIYNKRYRGFDLRTQALRIPQKRMVTLIDEGIEAPIIEFEPLYWKSYLKQQFLALINNDAEDLKYYDGRSDRYFRVKRAAVGPGFEEGWRGNYSSRVELRLEDPYLYADNPQEYNPGFTVLPATTQEMKNFGTEEAPCTFQLQGFHLGSQATNIYLKTMSGATEERSLLITPQLLSKELVLCDIEGWLKYYLQHTYDDSFTDISYWQNDSTRSGATIGSGQVSIASGGYFQYCFKGYSLLESIKLIAQLTVSAGSPVVEYSTDGSAWVTAISSSEISAGSGKLTTYRLTGTKSKTTVYVRFRCPTGAAMTVQSVSFELLRDLSSVVSQLPAVSPGEVRTFKVTGSGSGRAGVWISLTPRWNP